MKETVQFTFDVEDEIEEGRIRKMFADFSVFLNAAKSYFWQRIEQELSSFGSNAGNSLKMEVYKQLDDFSYDEFIRTLPEYFCSTGPVFDEKHADDTYTKVRPRVLSILTDALKKRDLPECFKVGRDMGLQFPEVVRQLDASHGHGEISSLDFSAFIFALSQVLYNQSYQAGNEEYNSGLDRCLSEVYTQDAGTPLYKGVVKVSLVELCRLGYGRAGSKDKKRMVQAISAAHNTYVNIKMGNVEKMVYLCVTKEITKDRKTGAITYTLDVNPYFGSRIKNNYGEIGQDIMKKLDAGLRTKNQRKTPAHYNLLIWVSMQDKRNAHTISVKKLAKMIFEDEAYRKDPLRCENQMGAIFEALKGAGIIYEYSIPTGKHGKQITFRRTPPPPPEEKNTGNSTGNNDTNTHT